MRMTLGRSMIAFGALCIGLVFLQAYRIKMIEADLVAARAELEATILGLKTTRPVLHGEAIEGLAFDHYARIGTLIRRELPEELAKFFSSRSTDNLLTAELRSELVDDASSALAAIQLGARSTDARYPFDWNDFSNSSLPTLMQTRAVVTLTILAAQQHLEEDRPELAVDALLDGLQLGGDMANVPIVICELIGLSLVTVTTEELVDEEFLAQFPRHELQRLSEALQLFDEALPITSHSSEGELLFLANLALNADQASPFFVPGLDLKLWRHGFSSKALYIDHILSSMQACEIMHNLDQEPWFVREAELARRAAWLEDSANALSDNPSNQWRMFEITRRESITRLRLARALIEFKLTGEVPRIADPFGGELRATKTGAGVRIESKHAAEAGTPERFWLESQR